MLIWAALASMPWASVAAADPVSTWAAALHTVCAANETRELCALAQQEQPAALEASADRLERAGRDVDAAVLERMAVARRRAEPGSETALTRDLAQLSMLAREAGNLEEAKTAAAEAVTRSQPSEARSPDADEHLIRAAALLADGLMLRAEAHYPEAAGRLRDAQGEIAAAGAADGSATADILDDLAELEGNAGKLSDAEAIARHAVSIRAQLGDPVAAARSDVGLALILRAEGHIPEAARLAQSAVAVDRKALPPAHPDLASALNAYGLVLRSEGKFHDAETVAVEALKIRLAAFPVLHPLVADSISNLAQLYQQEGQLEQAEKLYRRAIEIRTAALGPDHPDVGLAYNNLGAVLRTLGRYDDAEDAYNRAVKIEAGALGPDHPDVAVALSNLALVLRLEGHYIRAEASLQRALTIREQALPPDHPDIAATLTNLGEVLTMEGRGGEAEVAYKRALASQVKVLGPDHPSVAITVSDLAVLYRGMGRYPEAETLYRRALAIQQKVYPAGHPAIATTLGDLADLFVAENNFAEADRLQQAAYEMRVKVFGPRHPYVATSLDNLGILRWHERHFDEAEKYLRQTVALRLDSFGEDSPDVAIAYQNLAAVLRDSGQESAALDAMRRSTDIWQRRASRGEEAGDSAGAEAERKTARSQYENHVGLLEELAEKASGPARARLVDESFRVAQLAQNFGVGKVVAKMAARFAAGTGDLAALVRDEQDAEDQVRRLDAALVKIAFQPEAAREAAALEQIRDKRKALVDHVHDLDARIRRGFPQYAEAVSPDPVSVAEVQHLLRPDEALVSYLLTEQKGAFIWVIRHDSAVLLPPCPVAASQVVNAVVALRRGLDPARVSPETHQLPVYDTGLAYKLYKVIFEPMVPHLKGAKRLMIVADGPLQSLPLAVLVTKPAALPAAPQPVDYRRVDWLVRHYATAMLPSANSLRALRSFAHAASAPDPFLGIGDPRLGGARLKRHGPIPEGMVDVRLVKQLAPLPETANELRAMASELRSMAADDIVVGDAATRSRIDALHLDQFRVVAFATHGLLTGELAGLAEPALVLTPDASSGDDGLLRASQIAQLHFNADWVVLSACNTAASDGTVGAEGMSGLAKAFFYAGTRALLVSHWPVNSVASVQLTTTAIGLVASERKIGKAEAMRTSMVKLLDTGNPYFAHPMMWAPFVVVGEGGAAG